MSHDLLKSATHPQRVRFLYKFILNLHRSLPPTLKDIGDKYVKAEFQKHKNAKPEYIQPFMIEWTKYAVELSMQIRAKQQEGSGKSVDESKIGKPLDVKLLNYFSEAQLSQLLTLAKEIYEENQEPVSKVN
uniref:Succinate dehydrogenase assembly factor 3 n=1 Tax=Trichobilharzia regenti TaxID=157069 RepID=A0AA85KEY3_TRIRE|nr:unnamed protein product [Trichobilharzia regenti]